MYLKHTKYSLEWWWDYPPSLILGMAYPSTVSQVQLKNM